LHPLGEHREHLDQAREQFPAVAVSGGCEQATVGLARTASMQPA
jgi:hypothetical protein